MSLIPEVCAAVLNGDLPALESFLSAGGDINAPDANGHTMPGEDTLLTLAVSSGNIETIRFLLERGADPKIGGHLVYPLHLARDAQTAELLLANGARVDAQSAHSRSTALALWLELFGSRSTGQDSELILVLLRHGASLDVRNASGHDVLEIAQRLIHVVVQPETSQALESTIALLTAVRAAGSWKRYSREPSVKLWALRYLALAGRARAPPHFIRLFGAAPIPKGAARTRSKRFAGGASLPDEVFAHVLGFWDGNH